MEFKNHSSETVTELLSYLADHETFDSIKGLKDVSRADVANVLREIVQQLKEQRLQEPLIKRQQLGHRDIPECVHHVMANLSPKEEETLWKSFKIS